MEKVSETVIFTCDMHVVETLFIFPDSILLAQSEFSNGSSINNGIITCKLLIPYNLEITKSTTLKPTSIIKSGSILKLVRKQMDKLDINSYVIINNVLLKNIHDVSDLIIKISESKSNMSKYTLEIQNLNDQLTLKSLALTQLKTQYQESVIKIIARSMNYEIRNKTLISVHVKDDEKIDELIKNEKTNKELLEKYYSDVESYKNELKFYHSLMTPHMITDFLLKKGATRDAAIELSESLVSDSLFTTQNGFMKINDLIDNINSEIHESVNIISETTENKDIFFSKMEKRLTPEQQSQLKIGSVELIGKKLSNLIFTDISLQEPVGYDLASKYTLLLNASIETAKDDLLFRDEYDELKSKYETLMSTITNDDLKNKYETLIDATIESIKDDVSNKHVKEKYETLMSATIETVKEHDDLKEKYETLMSATVETVKENENLKNILRNEKHTGLNEKHDELKEKYFDLNDTHGDLISDYKLMKLKYSKLEDITSSFESKMEYMSGHIHDLQCENERYIVHNHELNLTINILKSDIEHITIEHMNTNENMIADGIHLHDEINSEVERLSHELERVGSKNNNIISALTEETSKAVNESTQLKAELMRLKNENSSKEKIYMDMNNKLIGLEVLFNELIIEKHRLENSLHNNIENEELKSEIVVLCTEISKIDSIIEMFDVKHECGTRVDKLKDIFDTFSRFTLLILQLKGELKQAEAKTVETERLLMTSTNLIRKMTLLREETDYEKLRQMTPQRTVLIHKLSNPEVDDRVNILLNESKELSTHILYIENLLKTAEDKISNYEKQPGNDDLVYHDTVLKLKSMNIIQKFVGFLQSLIDAFDSKAEFVKLYTDRKITVNVYSSNVAILETKIKDIKTNVVKFGIVIQSLLGM